MFAFLNKFKTEVRDFIADASGKLAGIETKVEQEFTDLKAKIESLFEAKKTEAVTAETTVVNTAVESVATKVEDAVVPTETTTDATEEGK